MVLAAGYGTRLSPLTDTKPKPLIDVCGKPLIGHVIEKLAASGFNHIVVNIHHHAGQMEEHFKKKHYGVEVTLLHENEILGTGGGILNARGLLDGDIPFLVHNSDILSDIDLRRLYEEHVRAACLATLAVNVRPTKRAVLFDKHMRFLGKEAWKEEGIDFPDQTLRFGFCGIHVIGPELFRTGIRSGFSEIFDIYRERMEDGFEIRGSAVHGMWTDLGSAQSIKEYERRMDNSERFQG